MLSIGKIMERESSLLHTYKGKNVCVKKFSDLGVKIVQDENGQCFLISAQGEGVFGKKIVNYGVCNKRMNQKDVLVFLKDFCMKPIREEIASQSQNNFDILLGFAVPTEAVLCPEFVNLLKNGISDLQKIEQADETVAEKFDPLLKSIDMAVSVAKAQPNTCVQVDEFYKNLGL